jgi:hypothetical protein
MSERDNDIIPVQPDQEAANTTGEISINPFAASQAVEKQQSRLNLGGAGVLSHAGVTLPTPSPERHGTGEVITNIEQAAKKVCGQIAEMFIEDGDPDAIVFPVCNDMAVIGESLRCLMDTPLGIGFGAFPDTVPGAWQRFMHETAANYRTYHDLETAALVPLKVEVPDWLSDNPAFDILRDCRLMDIEITGSVESTMAENAANCRITFIDTVVQGANIGSGAKRCSFIFEKSMYASNSFQGASNTSVHIKGYHSGAIGPMSTSKVACDGNWNGTFITRGTECTKGPGVIWGNHA